MPELIEAIWAPSLETGLSRRAREGCRYTVFVPDELGSRTFGFDGRTAADIGDAEHALIRLNTSADGLADAEALARLLLRAESVASSRIEGLVVGGRRLLRAQLAAREAKGGAPDVTASEILGNIGAMTWAVETVADREQITLDDLLEVHRRLLAGSRLEAYGGVVRTEQNWIGGSSFNPCSAAFVPPPPDHVVRLLDDLCVFCNADDLPAVAQAAIAHAQFETIHPFVDGNGRAGRALIHIILRRRGLTTRVLSPVSLVLATWSRDYVAGLSATRSPEPAGSELAVAGLNDWVSFFASAVRRSVADAEDYQRRVREIQSDWRAALGPVRSGSATSLLVEALPGAPIVTVQSAAALIGRSVQATNEAIARLVAAGVLKQTRVAQRYRSFEAWALIDAFADLERQLASPRGDTLAAPPARPVPHRRAD